MFGKNKKGKGAGALEEAKNWYADRYQFVVVQRNVLAVVTIIALAGLGVTTFAVSRIADSKTFEPYVIEVEDRTGVTALVETDSILKYTGDEMLIRYFLNQYVMAREGFRAEFYEYDYNTLVRLLSNSDVYFSFYESIKPETPGSPVALGAGFYREVKIKSIVFIAPKRAQIRVQVEQVAPASSDGGWVKHFILTVDFEFFPLELSLKDRYTNPLGFQVTGYRKDEDTAK